MTSTTLEPPITDEYRSVFADILSQAITGELIGMSNYAAMCRLYDDAEGRIDAVEHAANERAHARAFQRAADELGVTTIVNMQAPYWNRLRQSLLAHVDRADHVACLVIQEVMLEALAVSMYFAVADVAHDKLARTFRAIGEEEQGHIDHAIDELRAELEKNPDAFERKVEGLHDEVMTTIAEMLGANDSMGHCEVCHGNCVKDSLHAVGLSRATMRGQALNLYLRTLDRIGIRGERSLAWVARLPV
jgi:1,2-phenylacetyl-CoA epoxidase catalytic subunit